MAEEPGPDQGEAAPGETTPMVAPETKPRPPPPDPAEALQRGVVALILGGLGVGGLGIAGAALGGEIIASLAALLTGTAVSGASMVVPFAAAGIGLVMVFATFFVSGALRHLNPRYSQADLDKDDTLWDLSPGVDRGLRAIFTATVGMIFAIPLFIAVELFAGPVLLGLSFLLAGGGLLFADLAGYIDAPDPERVLPDAVLRIGSMLRTREVTCPFCGGQVTPEDESVACQSCEAIHHADCWLETDRCTTYGCGSILAREVAPEEVSGDQVEADPEGMDPREEP